MLTQTLNPDQLSDFLSEHSSFAIFGHEYVDGDAWWSMVWLGETLRLLGKSVTLFLTHPVPRWLDILQHSCPIAYEIDEEQHYDAIIFVDFSPLQRITKFIPHQEWILSHPIAIIDHHHEPKPLDITVYHKDSSACSTCILIADILHTHFPDQIRPHIADALLMGIMTDTGNFIFPWNYEAIFGTVLWLLQSWAKKEELTQKLFRSRSWASVQCSQLVLQRAILMEWFAWSWMYRDERLAFGVDKQESKAGMNILSSVEGIGCVVYIDITPTERKLHMRSKKLENGEHISCAKIMWLFGWGWHHCAAGATIDPKKSYTIDQKKFVPKNIWPTWVANMIYESRHLYCVDGEGL